METVNNEYVVMYCGRPFYMSGQNLTVDSIVKNMRVLSPSLPLDCHVLVEGNKVVILKEKPPKYRGIRLGKPTIEIRTIRHAERAIDPQFAASYSHAADFIIDVSMEKFFWKCIDDALARKDEAEFMRLSAKLKESSL